ncbi:2,3-diketo-5-methylthio-1-phosphopentane phosphatase [Ramicandelaber brevisporus]|nr:2,3-diketo-5-methylthio-1-phosphopentane phosphatase [Ramicandelaber brevisporus]
MTKSTVALVLDIEGTTTPISFVHAVLFPFARRVLTDPAFLRAHWNDAEFQTHVQALREQAAKDVAASTEFPKATLIPSDSENIDVEYVIEQIISNIRWQMDADRKIGALKGLQGWVWRSGYDSGELVSQVFADVHPAVEKWVKDDIGPVYIYSSGSVEAQKLLFKYTESGDFSSFISGNFDTVNAGLKQEASSYAAIAKAIGLRGHTASDSDVKVERALFVSDMPREIRAAQQVSGWLAALAMRPGNGAVTEEEKALAPNVTTFETLFELI